MDEILGSRLTVAQVAERVGKSRATINQWIDRGRLKATKINIGPRGAYLVEEKDLEDCLKADRRSEKSVSRKERAFRARLTEEENNNLTTPET